MKQYILEQYIKNVSVQVKTLRKKNGLTQIEFAKRVGVGLRFIRELERGKITVRMDKLLQVLDFLGYHLELKRNEISNVKEYKKEDMV
ncbi:MAG: type II toxin-antitoxin system Y4mF family antitoxin [Candidatus Omnitrophota bacterium]